MAQLGGGDGVEASNFSSEGLAIYTGATFTANQAAEVDAPLGVNPGPCVRMTVGGSGYCWDSNVGVVIMVNGTETTPAIISSNDCTDDESVDGGNLIKLTAVGTTITCSDLTEGTSGSATDATYSSGNPGMFTGSFRPATNFVAAND